MDAFSLSNMPANPGALLYLVDIRDLYLVPACAIHRAATQGGPFQFILKKFGGACRSI